MGTRPSRPRRSAKSQTLPYKEHRCNRQRADDAPTRPAKQAEGAKHSRTPEHASKEPPHEGETRRRTTGRAKPQQGGARRSRARATAHRSKARGRRAQASQPPARTRPTECARVASGRCMPAPVNARDEGVSRRLLCAGKTVQVTPGHDHRNDRRGGWSLARPLWKGDGASNWCR